eukprot:COSAG01_NODE_1922_length_8898_cov_24.642459_6_plen_79_part_00
MAPELRTRQQELVAQIALRDRDGRGSHLVGLVIAHVVARRLRGLEEGAPRLVLQGHLHGAIGGDGHARDEVRVLPVRL